MKIYDISFNRTICQNISLNQQNNCKDNSTVSTISNEPTTMITNIGLTFPGRVAPLKPISANEDNSIYGFNVVGMSEIDPCFGWACSNTLKICGNVEICKNLQVHGHTQLVDTSVNNLEVSGNLVVDGHSWLQDTSTNNLDVSGNLEVLGHTRVCDLSACNVDISQNLEVFGHTQFVDASGSGTISLYNPTATNFSTDINYSHIINDNPANRMHPMNNVIGPPPTYGLTLQADNLYIDLRETSNALGGFGMAIKLAANDEFANFRILRPNMQVSTPITGYIFQVDGSGVTQTRDIYPWQDCAWRLGKPTKRWDYLYACNISAVDISATNLTVSGNTNLTGHLTFADASGSNLSLSNNLWVTGTTNLTGQLTFIDASGSNLSLSNNLWVTGTTNLTGQLTFGDASGSNLTLTENLWIGILNFTNGFGTNLTLTNNLIAKNICAEGPTPIAGRLCVKDGNAGGGNPNGEIVFNMDGATGVLDIGTQNIVGSNSGSMNLYNNYYNGIVVSLDASKNSQNQLGEIRVGKAVSGTSVISGGRNTASLKTRSIDSSGSLLANSIIHVTNLPDTTSISSKKDSFLCMGGVPHKDWSINDPAFMIKMTEPASAGDHYGMFSYKFGTTDPYSSIIGLRRTLSKKRIGIGRDDPSIISYSFPINIHVCDPIDWVTAGGLLLPNGLSTIPGTSPLPSWTDRDPSNTICLNSNLFINRQTGIVIDAMDWDTATSSWAGAESALFIGKVDNNSDLRANSIVSPYKIGVQIGAGGTFGNTGCTVHGNIRNGTNGSNVYSFQTGNSHNGYIGCYASSTGFLGIPTNGTKFKGYNGDFFQLNLGQITSAITLAYIKAFNIENEKYQGNDFGPSGEQLTFSAVESPQCDCIFRGQSFVPAGGTLYIEMDKECSKFFNGNEDGTVPQIAPNSGIIDRDFGLLFGTFYSNFVYDPSGNWDTTGGMTGNQADLWCEANLNVQLTSKFNPSSGGGGGGGNFVLPYEPYNMNICLSEWSLTTSFIWYVQFIAPCTGTYTNMQFFTTHSSTPTYTGILGVAIYTNNPGQPGIPNAKIGEGKVSLSNANMDLSYNDITFDTAINLVANRFYWVAVAADNVPGELLYSGFHNDYNSQYQVVKYQTGGFSGGGGFPAIAPSVGLFHQGEYSYWFRIYSDVGGGFNGSSAISNTYHYAWSCIDFTQAHGIPITGKRVMLKIFQNDGEPFSVNQVIDWTITASRQDKRMYEMAQKYNGVSPESSLSQIRDVVSYYRPEDTAYFEQYKKLVWNPRCYKEPALDLSGNSVRRLDSFT